MNSRVGVFWDYENCRPPTGYPGAFVAAKIRQAVQPLGPATSFKAYTDTSLERQWEGKDNMMPSDLQSSGISLIHCPHNGGKEMIDKMLIVDILLFALEHPTHVANIPATVVLIAGDRDYSYLISTLRLRGHDIILIFPPNSTHAKLKDLPSAVLDWRADVLDCMDPGIHLIRLLPKTGGSFLPSPASSSFSRANLPSRGGSMSSLELSRVSPERSGSSGRGIYVNLSIDRSPSASDYSDCDVSLDDKEDFESFVCIDEIDQASTPASSIADLESDVRPVLTTSVTDIFSSLFKRKQPATVASPPLPALAKGKGPIPKPGDASSPARTKVASVTSSVSVQKRPAPEPSIAGPSWGRLFGSGISSLEENILQWSAGTTPSVGDPECIDAAQSPIEKARSECAESEICFDVFGECKPVPVSQGIVNNTESIEQIPATLPVGDDYKSTSDSCFEPTPPVSARSPQPTGPVRTCELSTVFNIPSPSKKKSGSESSTKASNIPSPSKKKSGSESSTKASNIPSPSKKKSGSESSTKVSIIPPPSKKKSGSGLSTTVFNIPPPSPSVSKKKSVSSTSSSSKKESNVQSCVQTDVRFTVLVEVLRKLREEGETQPDWARSGLGTLLFERDPKLYKKAGCSRMRQYLELASKNGVVVLGNVGTSDAWVKLKE